jgi:hypothetical protein
VPKWQTFQVEADVLKKLEHESCIAIPKLVYYGLESITEWPLLVTNKVGVSTMYQITLPLAAHDRIQIMADLREAVAVLHRHGLVYFDWHPANVMWQPVEEANGDSITTTMRALLVDYNECVLDGSHPNLDQIRFNPNFVASAMNVGSEDDLLRSVVTPVTCAFDLESLLYIELFLKTGTLPWIDNDEQDKKRMKQQWLAERDRNVAADNDDNGGASQRRDASEQSGSPKRSKENENEKERERRGRGRRRRRRRRR